jgi:hypothetical protein
MNYARGTLLMFEVVGLVVYGGCVRARILD